MAFFRIFRAYLETILKALAKASAAKERLKYVLEKFAKNFNALYNGIKIFLKSHHFYFFDFAKNFQGFSSFSKIVMKIY